jgi:signal transduction histidine kinase
MAGPSMEQDDWLGPGWGAHADRSDHQLLASRLRSGAWIVLAGSAIFLAFDLALVRNGSLLPLLGVKVVQCLVLVALLRAIGRLQSTNALRWAGAAAVTAVYLTTAESGLLRGEILTSTFLLIATTMATATFVPWGAWPQALTALGAGLALAATRLAMPLPLGREAVYRWLGTTIALWGTVWMAREHDRQRRERRRAERLLAAESRVASALARAGAEIIRIESTPGVLDSLCGLVAELLSCEQTALLLYDAGDDTFAVHSSFGHRAAETESVRRLRVPARDIRQLLDAFRAGDAVQVDTASIARSALRAQHERYRVAKSLYVPIRQAGEITGVLSAHYRDASRDFSDGQRRIAIGIAHLASMALQNTRLLDELREANRLKSDFVSTMSHELRTPVSVILGYTEMLADDLDPVARAALLARIRRSGLELLDLVEETLNLSRLEAGRDPPRFEVVELPEVFSELVAEFQAMVPLGDVALRWEGPESIAIRSDRRKLRMVLKNLVGNALKFTVAGEVVLSCRRDGDVVRFAVRDTGIGIAPQHLPFIFDMFRQADSSDARSYRGAGLGLYIAQRLVHQLGGEIHVASEVGRGSTFTFVLPVEPAAAEVSAAPPPAS